MVNGTVAGSNGGRREREASEGSLQTPRRVFEAILVEERSRSFLLFLEARNRVFP
jgi:hypothetical protein